MQLEQMDWESVGKVSKVFVYPVKSCKGNSVESANANFRGLVYKEARDRYLHKAASLHSSSY